MSLETELLNKLRYITEASAISCTEWIGRGDKNSADKAAVESMRRLIRDFNICAEILVGEGEKDKAPLLYKGERFGDKDPEWHIAVDPLEGTANLAKGLANAMSVICLCEKGKMFDPGSSFYMDKLAGPTSIKGKINPSWEIEKIINVTAEILGKPISEINIFILDKPRHKKLIERVYHLGAKVSLHSAGDVAGALSAALPDTAIDLLLGIGGTPEGLLSACAIKSIGGEFIGKLAPQLPSEIIKLKTENKNTERWYKLDELIASDKIFFSATGITNGTLFKGIQMTNTFTKSETLMLHGINQEHLLVKSFKNN